MLVPVALLDAIIQLDFNRRRGIASLEHDAEDFRLKALLLRLLHHFDDELQPFALNNALFAGHDEGAAAWGCIASHIETCKMNGVEPDAWLKSTLEKIAAGHPQSRLHELLPWNFDPASG